MRIELNGFAIELTLAASLHGGWVSLPLVDGRCAKDWIDAKLALTPAGNTVGYQLSFSSKIRTRLRLTAKLLEESDLFHLIPGNIFGDNNANHVRPGEFPCLTRANPHLQNSAFLWEFRADRASHPVSMLCCRRGAVGLSIVPYSADPGSDEGFIRNGVFASLPDEFGVSLGYGNDPLTFVEKTSFQPATSDLTARAEASGTLYAIAGSGRIAAHEVIRLVYQTMREVPSHTRSSSEALQALAKSFIEVNYSSELKQYTNRKCQMPVDTRLKPWRAIVEIGWTGGSMLAYPFMLAKKLIPDLQFPKTGETIFDEICTGWNEKSGLLFDTTLNRYTQNRPAGWNQSEINGWWSGFLPQTRDQHCAYTNAHAAYYLLRALQVLSLENPTWKDISLRVLDTAIELQRDDGAFGYIFSSEEKKVIDWDGFAGCWFATAMPIAWRLTGDARYLESAKRAANYYWSFVRSLTCWGAPMDTFKSIDSEGNLAFIRLSRLLHESTREDAYLEMLRDGAHYEYLWRYGFRTRPQCEPLRNSSWNSCGGSITSVSNPHIHPMSVVATNDLEYLAGTSADAYHQQRADDGIAWLLNTMELYPQVTGYGRYGVLSERTCPSDGLLAEVYYDDNRPSSTWWSYNAWAAGSAMEALAEKLLLK
jgi:hypothetical protein